jgi:hypothetical protein
MTRRDSLRALYEAVKAGTICNDDAIISADDLAMIEAVFPMTDDDSLPELVGLALDGSLDAALALHNAVLPDVPWNIWRSGDEYGCNITGDLDTEYAPDPARALLLADLAAMIKGEG